MSCKVSIIITAHNYGKYLPVALDSALNQNFNDFEVIVVNDGSTDHTSDILANYANHEKVKILTLDGIGLAAASNRGIQASSGEYIIRLDADDYFDENMLLVEATYLDNYPSVGLVFCDYYRINAHGEIIDAVRRAKVNDEVELLDRPALAAGAMYRRKCYDSIGGYNEEIRYQEDYDFWIKFIEKFQVRNVSVPLMYYRQHRSSMSRNWTARMKTRRAVKAKFLREHREKPDRQILAVVPARGDYVGNQKMPLLPLGSQTLIEHCVQKLRSVGSINRLIVSTDDPQIAELAIKKGAEVPYINRQQDSGPNTSFEDLLANLLRHLQVESQFKPDIIVIAHPHSPFITSDHVAEAIDTLNLFDTDSIIGVVEDLSYHWKHERNGLSPVGYQKRVLKDDKDIIYKEAGGLYVINSRKREQQCGDLLGKVIGHIELAPFEALRIQTEYNHWIACCMAKEKIWCEL